MECPDGHSGLLGNGRYGEPVDPTIRDDGERSVADGLSCGRFLRFTKASH